MMAGWRKRLSKLAGILKHWMPLLVWFFVGVCLAILPKEPVQDFLRKRFSAFANHPTLTEVGLRILTGAGEAMAIAMVLSMVVEEASRRKILKEFAQDVSGHIIGRFLPVKLREHIHTYLSVNFVRYNWQVIYTLSVFEKEGADYVKCVTKSSYEIENRSPDVQEYPLEFEVEESWFPRIGQTSITAAKIRNLKESRDVFEARTGRRLQTKIEDGFVKLISSPEMTVSVPGHDPHDPNAAPRYYFEVESEEYFRDSFQSVFSTFHPVFLSTTVTVLYPRDKLKVNLSLTFDEVKKPEDMEHGKKWTIEKPILKGQGFVVRWDPIPRDGHPAPQSSEPTEPTSRWKRIWSMVKSLVGE